jgi:hypothetical protein
MPKKRLLEEIVRDPRKFHRAPLDVIRDRRFSNEEQLEILSAWERQIRSEDGAGELQRLQFVTHARAEVQQRARPEQGG